MSGRPSIFTDELAEQICDRLIAGESLRRICEDEDMPHRITVIRWMRNNPDFATKCAQARDEQADLMDDRILDVADKVEAGELDPHAAKVVISALQWRASKLKPKKYGDKLALTGDENAPPITFTIAPNPNATVNLPTAEAVPEAACGDVHPGPVQPD